MCDRRHSVDIHQPCTSSANRDACTDPRKLPGSPPRPQSRCLSGEPGTFQTPATNCQRQQGHFERQLTVSSRIHLVFSTYAMPSAVSGLTRRSLKNTLPSNITTYLSM